MAGTLQDGGNEILKLILAHWRMSVQLLLSYASRVWKAPLICHFITSNPPYLWDLDKTIK